MPYTFENTWVLAYREYKFNQQKYYTEGDAGVCMTASLEFISQCVIRDSKAMPRKKKLSKILTGVQEKMEEVVKKHREADKAIAQLQNRDKQLLNQTFTTQAQVARAKMDVVTRLDDMRRLLDNLRRIAKPDDE